MPTLIKQLLCLFLAVRISSSLAKLHCLKHNFFSSPLNPETLSLYHFVNEKKNQVKV